MRRCATKTQNNHRICRLLDKISGQKRVQNQTASAPAVDRISAAIEEAEAGTEERKKENLNIILVSSEVARCVSIAFVCPRMDSWKQLHASCQKEIGTLVEFSSVLFAASCEQSCYKHALSPLYVPTIFTLNKTMCKEGNAGKYAVQRIICS
jgi:hypothetical protein